MEEKALEIIKEYGVEHQQRKLAEEVYELQQAINVYEAGNDEFAKEHIAEELADVMVMLTQFKTHYDISVEEIEMIMKFKINRQLERIKNDKQGKKEIR